MYEQCLECKYLSKVSSSVPCTAQTQEQCPEVGPLDAKGQPLCDLWLMEVRRIYGEEIADESIANHVRGWYYLSVAVRYKDGSVNAKFYRQTFRRSQVIEMVEDLRKREANDVL